MLVGSLAMTRRFRVRDSYSCGFTTSTGLAESCAMSCYGTLILDDIMHRYTQAQYPSLQVLSFVDNWDFLTWDPATAERQLEALMSFPSLADLTVDMKKTFFLVYQQRCQIQAPFLSPNLGRFAL